MKERLLNQGMISRFRWGAIVAGLALVSVAHTADAQRRYGMGGCGLGSLVFGADDGFMQVFAYTTNLTSYNQSFGITSGTSNCIDDNAMAAIRQQEDFVTNNLSSLAKDMAQGSGETLSAFTESLGCQPQVFPQVAETLQANYQEIFSYPGAISVLWASKGELAKNPALAASCAHI